MAKIFATKARKTYKGTNKADVIEFSLKAGDKIKVNALAGNDKISVLGGSKHTINTGAGIDKVYLKKGNSHTVITGKGTNYIYVKNGTNHTITGSDGVDKLYVSSGSVKSAKLGAGNDVVEVTGGTLKSVNLGAGSNKATISGGVCSSIIGGKNNDVIVVSKQKKININVGSGNNNITVNGINNNYFSKVSKGKILGGSGVDTVKITKGGFYKVGTYGGNDVINITNGSHIVNSGDGDDRVTVSGKYSSFVYGDKGNDTLTLKGNIGNALISGGYGDDTIYCKSTNPTGYYNIIEGEGGSDTYHVYYLNAPTIINASPIGNNDGKDTLIIHQNMNSVSTLEYASDDDTLLVNDRLVIGGLSNLKKISIDSDTGMVDFSVSQIKSMSNYVYLTDALPNFINEYRNNLYSVMNDVITQEIAQNVGYKGL